MAEFDKTSGFFTAFRQDFGFVYFHKDARLDWFRDVGVWGIGLSYIVAILTLTIVLAFLGTRGYSRWRVTLQLIISLAIGVTILVAVTGISWQGAEYSMTMNGVRINYVLNVGLRQANITMTRINDSNSECLEYHNVKIGWIEIDQAEREYRDALLKGWPLPVLRIAHYLSIDMGEMRYMRAFRWSGYMAYILLWITFCLWLLANIVLRSKISYAALSLLLTGCVLLITCIMYDKQQPPDFYIPMDDGKGSQLRLRYYWMFWLTAFTGIFVVLLSVIVLILDYLRPADMNKFFGTQSEIQSPYEEELKFNRNKDIKGMISQLSFKRSLSLRKRVTIDPEARRHMDLTPSPSIATSPQLSPGNSKATTPNGVDNKEFEADDQPTEAHKSLTSNGKCNGVQNGRHIEIPEIHVELSDFPQEDTTTEDTSPESMTIQPQTDSEESTADRHTIQTQTSIENQITVEAQHAANSTMASNNNGSDESLTHKKDL